MVNPRYKEQIIRIIRQYLPDCTIYLYGSRARKTNVSGSDIDLALDNGTPITDNILAHIRFDIEETTIPLMVDVVDARAIDREFYETISKEWVIWKQ